METENSESSSPQIRKSRWLFRLTLILGIPLLLFIILLSIICGPDQIRTLTISGNPYEPALNAATSKKIREFAQQPASKDSHSALLEIARAAYPLPDLAKLSADHQKQARFYQDKICELAVQTMLLPEKTKTLDFESALKQLQDISNKQVALTEQYKDMLYLFPQKVRNGFFTRNNAFWLGAVTEMNILRGEWIEAAKYNIGDWDKATFYLRQSGLPGRAVLVIWSIQRRLHPEYFK